MYVYSLQLAEAGFCAIPPSVGTQSLIISQLVDRGVLPSLLLYYWSWLMVVVD